MEKIEVKAQQFIGKPFMPSMADENGSFYSQYLALEDDESFSKLDSQNQLATNRASLIIFGPENFQYWQGMLFRGEEADTSLLSYQLPDSAVLFTQKKATQPEFNLPLNFVVPNLLQEAKKSGFTLPNNLGLSEHPYVLQIFKSDEQVIETSLYLGKISADVND